MQLLMQINIKPINFNTILRSTGVCNFCFW